MGLEDAQRKVAAAYVKAQRKEQEAIERRDRLIAQRRDAKEAKAKAKQEAAAAKAAAKAARRK